MLKSKRDGGKLMIFLEGSIDSSNAAEIEQQIKSLCSSSDCNSLVLNCDKLNYCSSVGLRVILRLKKAIENTSIINAHSELYEILEMTGFTDMMEVHKAFRTISVAGCPVIGQGANGRVYRLDNDKVVKVYINGDAIPEIDRERELARKAFIAGVPTAIPYEIVRIEEGGYGSVFELLNAQNMAELLTSGEKTVDEVAALSVELIQCIHSKLAQTDSLPDVKLRALQWADFLEGYLSKSEYDKLHALIQSVPDDQHMLHGDFNLKNIIYQNGECLLIDMDTICHGHPIFELAGIYNSSVGYGALDRAYQEKFIGIPYETSLSFWQKCLSLYLNSEDPAKLSEVEAKAKIIGCARIMRREIRRNALAREDGRRMIDYCARELSELLSAVDTLEF